MHNDPFYASQDRPLGGAQIFVLDIWETQMSGAAADHCHERLPHAPTFKSGSYAVV